MTHLKQLFTNMVITLLIVGVTMLVWFVIPHNISVYVLWAYCFLVGVGIAIWEPIKLK